MSLIDNENLFCEDQAITASGDTDSTNVIDVLAAGKGAGNLIPIVGRVTTTFTSGGSAKLQMKVYTGTAADDVSTLLTQSDAIAVATCAQGYKFKIPALPKSGVLRFLKITWAVTAAKMTAGAVSAYIGTPEETNVT